MDKNIIIDRIKNNKRYIDDNELTEVIVNLVSERIEGVIDDIKDDDAMNKYLDRIVSKSIIEVLKTKGFYHSKSTETLQKINYKTFSYNENHHKVPSIPISKLKQIYTMLKKTDENDDTEYMQILKSRYKEKQTLTELSKTLQKSEQEIIDILFNMSDYADKVTKV